MELIHGFSALFVLREKGGEIMTKKIKKILKKNMKLGRDPDFQAKADHLEIPKCPECNAPLLAGFGNSSGDYFLCLNCGAEIPLNFEDSKER